MKILLDECVDQRLRRELSEHDVSTVKDAGWAGMKNGELLETASKTFDVFLTIDRNIWFQQNRPALKLAVVILKVQTSRLADLKPLVPELKGTLSKIRPGEVVLIST